MKIKDNQSEIYYKEINLFLTIKEAKELSIEFEKLLENPMKYIVTVKGEDLNGKLSKEISIKIEG